MKNRPSQTDSKAISLPDPARTIPESDWSGWYFDGEFLCSPNNDRFTARCIQACFFWRQMQEVGVLLRRTPDHRRQDRVFDAIESMQGDGEAAVQRVSAHAAPRVFLLTDSQSESNGGPVGNA